jgi:hypothetical protein
MNTTLMACARCEDEGWVCEAHPEVPWPHGDRAGPGTPCPDCNATNPPRPPPGFVTFVRPC